MSTAAIESLKLRVAKLEEEMATMIDASQSEVDCSQCSYQGTTDICKTCRHYFVYPSHFHQKPVEKS